VPFAVGVVVTDIGIPGPNPPSGNMVRGNVILNNEPDVFWDGSGEGSVFRANVCETSVRGVLLVVHRRREGDVRVGVRVAERWWRWRVRWGPRTGRCCGRV